MEEGVITAIEKLVHESEAKILKTEDGREFLIKNGSQVSQEVTPPSFTPELPGHIRQAVTLSSKDSFVDYLLAFRVDGSRLFANLSGGSFLAVLDYHSAPLAPNFITHRATLTLQASVEWKRWSEISGKLMAQPLFVRFLEENMADIETPSGAEILELASDFAAARKVNFTQAYRSQTGDTSIEYASEVEGRAKSGSIAVPNKFTLRIPIYYGEPTIEVSAFLRYSIDEGHLKLGIELHRPEYIRQAVFEQIGGEIRDRTSLPLHYGSIG